MVVGLSSLVHGTITESDTTAASQLSATTRKLQFIKLKCDDTSTFYFGTSLVTSTSGFTLGPNSTFSLDFRPASAPYSNLYVASNSTGHRIDWVGIVEK